MNYSFLIKDAEKREQFLLNFQVLPSLYFSVAFCVVVEWE